MKLQLMKFFFNKNILVPVVLFFFLSQEIFSQNSTKQAIEKDLEIKRQQNLIELANQEERCFLSGELRLDEFSYTRERARLQDCIQEEKEKRRIEAERIEQKKERDRLIAILKKKFLDYHSISKKEPNLKDIEELENLIEDVEDRWSWRPEEGLLELKEEIEYLDKRIYPYTKEAIEAKRKEAEAEAERKRKEAEAEAERKRKQAEAQKRVDEINDMLLWINYLTFFICCFFTIIKSILGRKVI